jgi:hypothetical protein
MNYHVGVASHNDTRYVDLLMLMLLMVFIIHIIILDHFQKLMSTMSSSSFSVSSNIQLIYPYSLAMSS